MTIRPLLALGASALLAAGGLSACGDSDSVPGNAVAKVGDESITRDDFNHWVRVYTISTRAQTSPTGSPGKVTVPDPPDYASCVNAKKAAAPKPAKGQARTTDAQYKTQCKQEYEAARDQVLSFLISAEWIEGEASERDVAITDKEVDKQFQDTVKQSFPKEADFQRFLKSSGLSREDLTYQVRVRALTNKLRDRVTKGKDKVTQAQIANYYEKNKARFAQAERRDLRLVLTKTEARANEAKAAIEGGRSFASVAKEYSTDQASKNQGGVLLGVTEGQQEPALDKAAFAAERGELTGPVQTDFGWYVFEVRKITPKSQQTLQQATPTIRQLLVSQGQQKALDDFVKDFQKRWKEQTNCRSGFVVQSCKNAPKQSTTGPGGTQTQTQAPPSAPAPER